MVEDDLTEKIVLFVNTDGIRVLPDMVKVQREERMSFLFVDYPLGWSRAQKQRGLPPTTTPLYQLTTHIDITTPRKEKHQIPNLEGHLVGGYPDDSSGLRMFGLINQLPINFLSNRLPANFLYNVDYLRKNAMERRKERALKRTSEKNVEVLRSTSPASEKKGTTGKPSRESTTPDKMTDKQGPTADGEESESVLRREIARMNLDVLRQLSTMLGQEREKYAAERQMLRASRDMMRAETRKVISERFKLDSERQKVDLERDMLQSQILARKFLPDRTVGFRERFAE